MPTEPSPDRPDAHFSHVDLSVSLEEIERSVMDLEPKVRDLNRQLVSLLGRCPVGESGNWAYLARNDQGEFCVAFETLPFDKVLQIASHIQRVVDVFDAEGLALSPGQSHGVDLAPSILGDAAQLTYVPATHVRVVRPS